MLPLRRYHIFIFAYFAQLRLMGHHEGRHLHGIRNPDPHLFGLRLDGHSDHIGYRAFLCRSFRRIGDMHLFGERSVLHMLQMLDDIRQFQDGHIVDSDEGRIGSQLGFVDRYQGRHLHRIRHPIAYMLPLLRFCDAIHLRPRS